MLKPFAALRVAALVVTYDRPDDLCRVVAALRGQTRQLDAIVVFDNHGPEPAAEVLADLAEGITIIRSEENLGGAGGFAAGLAYAAGLLVDWVWLMDDDALPEADALSALLAAMPLVPGPIAALCGAVYEFGAVAGRHRRYFDRRFGIERSVSLADYDRPWCEIDTGSFVGFLVSVEAVRAVGLPDPAFFLAYDDTEYSLRLRASGRRLYLVPASRIIHRRTSRSRLRTSRFGAKHYFNIRNRLVVKQRYAAYRHLALVPDLAFALALWIVCGGAGRPCSLPVLWRALSDGFSGRLGPFTPGAPPARPEKEKRKP